MAKRKIAIFEHNMSINVWEHLFVKGEYPSREKLLSDLTIAQLNEVPNGVSHSIYEEFWHLTSWQDTLINKDESKHNEWQEGIQFPPEKPGLLKEWEELKNKFFNGIEKILEYSSEPENLKKEIEPGFNAGETLNCLAVHNAVHFGKILAIRQMIGAWPPK